MSSLEKYIRIKTLEYIAIKLGLDTNDVDATQEIIKDRNANIQTLCMKLKLPIIEHP